MSANICLSLVAMRAEAKVPALRLRHEGADDGNAGEVGGDGVVKWGVVAKVPEEVMAAGNTAGAGSGQVQSV